MKWWPRSCSCCPTAPAAGPLTPRVDLAGHKSDPPGLCGNSKHPMHTSFPVTERNFCSEIHRRGGSLRDGMDAV